MGNLMRLGIQGDLRSWTRATGQTRHVRDRRSSAWLWWVVSWGNEVEGAWTGRGRLISEGLDLWAENGTEPAKPRSEVKYF